jgi:hypothetical protein
MDDYWVIIYRDPEDNSINGVTVSSYSSELATYGSAEAAEKAAKEDTPSGTTVYKIVRAP